MPHRKRRFEALEDRRLLTALVGPMTPGAQSADTASNAASSPAAAAATTPSDSTDQQTAGQQSAGQGQSPADTSNDSAEYASASTPSSPASTGTPSSYGYGSSYDYGSKGSADNYSYPTNSTDSYSSPKTPTPTSANSATPAGTTSLTSAEATAGQTTVSSATPAAFSVPVLGPGPSASASAPAAQSPSAPLALEQEGAASSVAQGPDSLTESVLTAPVALAGSATDFYATRQADQIDKLAVQAEEITPEAGVRAGAPIAGSSVINFAAIEQGIDEVFDRIERLGDDLVGRAGATRFAEWLVIAGGACAAFEYARIRFREAAPWQSAGPWPVLCEPRLRRRWFRGRSGR